jgi:hypothetical protein
LQQDGNVAFWYHLAERGERTIMLHYICIVVLLFIVISIVWPDPRKKQAETDHKHKELVATISKMERQIATLVPAPPTPPKYTRAYRDRVIALGRQRDLENGVKRHPLLDASYVSHILRFRLNR